MDEEKELMEQRIAVSNILKDITKKKAKENIIIKILFVISVFVNILLVVVLLNGAEIETTTTDSYNKTITQEVSGENSMINNVENDQYISGDTYNNK